VLGRTFGRIVPVEETVMPAVYVNSARPIFKAFCGEHGGHHLYLVQCAEAVIEWSWARREKILFFPDEHLGRNTANKMGSSSRADDRVGPVTCRAAVIRVEAIQRAKLILWKGHCSVHQMFQPVPMWTISSKQYPDVQGHRPSRMP
jgi:quinolinate synthase